MTAQLISADAEQIILGSLIQHPENWKQLAGKLSRTDFAHEDYGNVWHAISELVGAGAVVNAMTVTHRIGKDHWPMVQGLVRGAMGATQLDKYADIVKDRSIRRRLAAIDPYMIATESETAAEAVGKVRSALDSVTADAVKSGPRMISEIMDDWKEELKSRKDHGGGVRGVSCGIQNIDQRWSGLCGGQFIVIAGRPGNGKTTLAMNMAQHVASAGKSVLVFSFEMHDIELTDKLVSARGGVYLSQIKTGALDADGWSGVVDAVGSLKDIRLAIDTGTSRSIDQIRLTCRAHALRYGLDLVIVDYIQQVSADAKERRHEVEKVSRGLKLTALEMNIPVIGLSQMSRAVEGRSGKRPMLSDLRESGAIEQDADIVAFAHRPDLVGEGDHWKGFAEIITAKSRHTEPGVDVIRADLARSRFLPYDGAPPMAEAPKGGQKRTTGWTP